RPGDQIGDCAGHKNFRRSRQSSDPGTDMDRDTSHVGSPELALPRVEPDSDLDAQSSHCLDERPGASDRPAGSVERRQMTIPGRVDEPTPELLDLSLREAVEAIEKFLPSVIAELRGAFGRTDDVGEQHGREDAAGRRGAPM